MCYITCEIVLKIGFFFGPWGENIRFSRVFLTAKLDGQPGMSTYVVCISFIVWKSNWPTKVYLKYLGEGGKVYGGSLVMMLQISMEVRYCTSSEN